MSDEKKNPFHLGNDPRFVDQEQKASREREDDGGPAFPVHRDLNPDGYQAGVRVWDYYAAHAPIAILGCAEGATIQQVCDRLKLSPDTAYEAEKHFPAFVALLAGDYATSMVAERKKRLG